MIEGRILPSQSPETKPFWDAARERKLLIQRCEACGKYQYHYRAFCCHCWNDSPQDVVSEGRGQVWSFSVIERNRTPGYADAVPYVVARVELVEGVRLLTNIEECDPREVVIGMSVRVDFAELPDGWVLPVFRPQ